MCIVEAPSSGTPREDHVFWRNLPSRTGYFEILSDQSNRRNESRRAQHLHRNGRISWVPANSCLCHIQLSEAGVWTQLAFLESLAWRSSFPCCQTWAACACCSRGKGRLQIATGFLQFKKLPILISNQGTEMEYSLLGKLDCCQEEDKLGVLSYALT